MAQAGLRKIFILLAGFLLLLTAPARGAKVQITADSMTGMGEAYLFEGSVVLKREGAVIRTERALYNRLTGDVEATGGVTYEDPQVSIQARRAELNLVTRTGTLHDASIYIKEEGFHVKGEEVRRVAPDRYTLRRASATTCEGDGAAGGEGSPDWCLRGRKVNILLGEWLKATHATFRIKGVPVLYTPYLNVPIIRERRTGLLMPTAGYRDLTGFFYSQPFFWAMADNRDATFTVDYYSRRALGGSVEYRYVEGPKTEGRLYVRALDDSERDEVFSEWQAFHRQRSRNAGGILDLRVISHDQYLRIYEPYLEQSATRFTESTARLWAWAGPARLFLLGRFRQDLKEGVDDDTVVQSLPEAGAFLTPTRVGPLLFMGDADGVRFDRDLGARGQRYDLRLRTLHTLGRVPALTQSVEVRETLYDLARAPGEDSLHSEVFTYQAALEGAFIRPVGGYRHSLEPALTYRYVLTEGDTAPFFDLREQVRDESVVALTLLNRLYGEGGEYLTARVEQGYDFGDGNAHFLPLLLEVVLRRPFYAAVSGTYDQEEGRVAAVNSALSFSYRLLRLTAGQSFDARADVSTYTLRMSRPLTRALDVAAGLRYDDKEEGGFEEIWASLGYLSQCWGARVAYVRRPPDDFTVLVNVSLKGLGEVGIR
ncbi:MAG: LPS assembly protein LptD [Nitrospirota bacterium]|jgi:LPS-assembly protein